MLNLKVISPHILVNHLTLFYIFPHQCGTMKPSSQEKKKSKSFFPPKTMKRLPILRLTLWPLIIYQATFALAAVDPTQGFTRVPLDNSNFVIQKPYDVSVNQRYSFTNGVHKFWVYSTDKPHTPASDTKPRTEIRINVCKPHLDAYSIILLFYFIKNI